MRRNIFVNYIESITLKFFKQKNPRLSAEGFRCSLLYGKNFKNVFANNHEDEVDQPYNPETKENTEDARNDLTVRKTRDDAANPRSNGDNSKNYAYDIRKTKVIATFCHVRSLLLIFLYFHYTMYMRGCQVYF